MSRFMQVYEPTNIVTESMLNEMIGDTSYTSYQPVTEGLGSVVKTAWEYIKKFFNWLFEKIKALYLKIKRTIKKLLGMKDDEKKESAKQEPKQEPEKAPESKPSKAPEPEVKPEPKEPEKVPVPKQEPKPEPKKEPEPEPEHKEPEKPAKQLFPVTFKTQFNYDNEMRAFEDMVNNAVDTCNKFINSMKTAVSSININKDNPEETELPSTVDVEEAADKVKELRNTINEAKNNEEYEFDSIESLRLFLENIGATCNNIQKPTAAALNLVDGVCKKWDVFEFCVRDKIDPQDKLRQKELVKHMSNKSKLIWSWFQGLYDIAKDIGGVCGSILTGLNADYNTVQWWIVKNVIN